MGPYALPDGDCGGADGAEGDKNKDKCIFTYFPGTHVPASDVVKLTGDEGVPTPSLLTAATIHPYMLCSSRPVMVIEVPVVLVLTAGSPKCTSLSSMLYWIM